MAENITKIRQQITEFFEKMERKQKIRLAVLAALIVVVSVAAVLILGRTEYTVLYSNLDAAEAGEILEALEAKGIDAKTEGTDTILVASLAADQIRMTLAAEGYPKTGLNYDLFNSANGLSSTDFDKRTNLQFQLQENLRRTINQFDKIASSIVFVNLASESTFALDKNAKESSASIQLTLEGDESLENWEAKAIGQLVVTSVPGLKLENVNIVDSNMKLYDLFAPLEEDDPTMAMSEQLALRQHIEDTLSEQVMELLRPVFGSSNVKAAVSATLNFDDYKETSVVFSPPVEGSEDGIIVSYEDLYEAWRDDELAGGVPGTDTNGMGVPGYIYEGLDDGEYYEKLQRTINYEINETQSQLERAKGYIERLSVAVLLNESAVSADYTEKVANLVTQAIGVSSQYVSVEQMPFQSGAGAGLWNELSQWGDMLESMRKSEIIMTAIKAFVVVIIAVLIFLFLRTMFRKAPEVVLAGVGYEEGSIIDLVADDSFVTDPGEESIELADISREKSGTASQIEKFIEKDSEAAAQLLRNWLADEYGG